MNFHNVVAISIIVINVQLHLLLFVCLLFFIKFLSWCIATLALPSNKTEELKKETTEQ